ncbi:hypothetical protein FRC11_015027 [Ceratobasidium sp. 423]|nr:hypothetical protein FRC11_015027 [Ceratobasidium sp. 423]
MRPEDHGIDKSGTTDTGMTLSFQLDLKRAAASPEFNRAFYIIQQCIAIGEDIQVVGYQVRFALNILLSLRQPDPTAHDDLYLSKVLALCAILTSTFHNIGEIGYINLAIEIMEPSLDKALKDPSRLWVGLVQALGVSYLDRFGKLEDPSDIDRAVECQARVLSVQIDVDGPDTIPQLLGHIGSSYIKQYMRFQGLRNLDLAITCLSAALPMFRETDKRLLIALNELGRSHLCQYEDYGTIRANKKAIECWERALNLAQDDHEETPLSLMNLGATYIYQFKQLGKQDDIEKSIAYLTQAISILDAQPSYSEFYIPGALMALGGAYGLLFDRSGRL